MRSAASLFSKFNLFRTLCLLLAISVTGLASAAPIARIASNDYTAGSTGQYVVIQIDDVEAGQQIYVAQPVRTPADNYTQIVAGISAVVGGGTLVNDTYDFDGNPGTALEQCVSFIVDANTTSVKFTYGPASIGIDNSDPRPEFRIAIKKGGAVVAMDASDRPDLYILAAGSGTASIVDDAANDAAPDRKVAAGASGVNLTLTYTKVVSTLNGGQLQVIVPDGWTAPTADNFKVEDIADANANGTDDTKANTGALSFSGQAVTIPVSGDTFNNNFVFKYSGAIAPMTVGNNEFAVKVKGPKFMEELTRIADMTNVTIATTGVGNGDAAGSFALTVNDSSPGQVTAISQGNSFVITFTAAGTLDGGRMEIGLPSTHFSAFDNKAGEPGYTTVSSTGTVTAVFGAKADSGFSGNGLGIEISKLRKDETVTVNYGYTSGPSGVTVDAKTTGFRSFPVSINSSGKVTGAANEKVSENKEPTFEVLAASGSGTLTVQKQVGDAARGNDVAATVVNAGDAITLYFNYEAAGKIKNGSLLINLDPNWQTADSDSKDADGNFTGNVSVVNKSGGAELGAISGVGHQITVPLTFMKAGQAFDVKYVITAPIEKIDETTFTFSMASVDYEALTEIKSPRGTGSPHKIKVTQAKDGSGVLSTPAADDSDKYTVTAGSTGNNYDVVYTAAGRMDKGRLIFQVPTNFPTPVKDKDGNISVSVVSSSGGVSIAGQPTFDDADKVGDNWYKGYFAITTMAGTSTVTFRYTGGARDVINTIDTTQAAAADKLVVYSKGSDLNADNTGAGDVQVVGGKVTVETTFAADGTGVAKFVDGNSGTADEKDTLTSKVKTLLTPAGNSLIIRYSPVGQTGFDDTDNDGVKDAGEEGKGELQFVLPPNWTAPQTANAGTAGYIQVKKYNTVSTNYDIGLTDIKIATNTVTVSKVYLASSAEKVEFQYFKPTTSGRAVDTNFDIKHASNGGTLVAVNTLVYNLGGAEDGIGSAMVEIMGKTDDTGTANIDERRTIAAGTSSADIQVTITAEADIINKEIEIIVPARDSDANKTAEFSMGQPQTTNTNGNAYVMPLVAGATLLNGADATFASSIDAATGELRPGVFGQKIQLKVNRLAYSADAATRPKILVQIKNVKIPTANANETYTFTVGSREAAADLNVNTADKKFGQGVDYDAVDAVNKLTVLEVVEAGDVTVNAGNRGDAGRNNDLTFLEDKQSHYHSAFDYGDLTIVVQPVAGEGVAKVGSMQSGNYNPKYITNTAATYNLTLTYEATTEISDVWFDVPAQWTMPDFTGNKVGDVETTPTEGIVSVSLSNGTTANVSISGRGNLTQETAANAANLAKMNQNKVGNVGSIGTNAANTTLLNSVITVPNASKNASPDTTLGAQIRVSANGTSLSGDGTLLAPGEVLYVNIANTKFTGSAATDSIFKTYSNGTALKSGLHPVVSLITSKDGIGRVDDELTTRVTHMTEIKDEFQFVSGTEKADLITPRFQDNEAADQIADRVEYAVGESKTMYFYYGIEKGTFIKDGELQMLVPSGFSAPTVAEADAALDAGNLSAFGGLQSNQANVPGFNNKKQLDVRLLYLSQDGNDNVTVVDAAVHDTEAELTAIGLSDKTDIPISADDITISGNLVKIKLRHMIGNQHFLQVKYHGKAPNLIGYYDRGTNYEGKKTAEVNVNLATFNVTTINGANTITNTPDVELTADAGGNFIDDELEDDVMTGEIYAFQFWSQSGPSSLGHTALTVEKNRVYNETTNQYVTAGQVRVNVSGGSVLNADIALAGVLDGAGTDTDAVDFRKALACEPNMIFHFTYTPKVEISAKYNNVNTNLVLRLPVNKWSRVPNDAANFSVSGSKRIDAVKASIAAVGLGGNGLSSYQDIIIPITTADIKTVKPGETIDIYYGYGDNKITAPMTYGDVNGDGSGAAITVRDFVVGQGNAAGTALDGGDKLKTFSIELGDQSSGAGAAEMYVDANSNMPVIDKTHNGVSKAEYNADGKIVAAVAGDKDYKGLGNATVITIDGDRQQIHAGSKFDAMLKYTSCGTITDGEIRFTIPNGFTAPQVGDSSAAGYVDLFYLDRDGDIDNDGTWDGTEIKAAVNGNTAGYEGVLPVAANGPTLYNWNHLFPVLDTNGRPFADHREGVGAINYEDDGIKGAAGNGRVAGLDIPRAVYDVEYGARKNDSDKDLPASIGLPIVSGQTVSFKVNRLVAGGVLALRYKAAVAPVTRAMGANAAVFGIETRSAYGQGDFVAVSSLQAQSMKLDILNGVGLEDGAGKSSGNITVSPTSVPAGSTNTYTVTYSPYASLSKTVGSLAGGNNDGQLTVVEVSVPQKTVGGNATGWTFPEANNKIDESKVKVTLTGGAAMKDDNKDGIAVTPVRSGALNDYVQIEMVTLEPGQSITVEFQDVVAPPQSTSVQHNSNPQGFRVWVYPKEGAIEAGATKWRGPLAPLTADSDKVTVAPATDGSGVASLGASSHTSYLINAGGAPGNLKFVYTAQAEMAEGAQIALNVDSAWPNPHTDADEDVDNDGTKAADEAGYVAVGGTGAGDVDVTAKTSLDGNQILVTVKTGQSLTQGETIIFEYGNAQLKAPAAPGTSYKFDILSKKKDGTLTSVKDSPLNVYVSGDGTGTGYITLSQTTVRATGTLTTDVTFELAETMAAGQLKVTIPAGWDVPKAVSGDPATTTWRVSSKVVGTVTTATAGKATFDPVNGANETEVVGTFVDNGSDIVFDVPAGAVRGDKLIFTYSGKVQATAGSVSIPAVSKSNVDKVFGSVLPGLTATVQNIVSGEGTAERVGTNPLPSRSKSNVLQFKFTAKGTMDGGAVRLQIPNDFTLPQTTDPNVAGYTTAYSTGSIGNLEITDSAGKKAGEEGVGTLNYVKVPLTTLAPAASVTVVYGSGGADAGVQAQAAPGFASFYFESSGGVEGDVFSRASISNMPVQVTDAPHGSGGLTIPSGDISAGENQAVQLLYTAVGTSYQSMLRVFKPTGTGWADFSATTISVVKPSGSATTRFSTPTYASDGSYLDLPLVYISDSKSVQINYTSTAPNQLQVSSVSASFANTNVADDLLPLSVQPTITVKGAADGSGSVSIASGTLTAGSPAGPIVLTYTTVGPMDKGGITIDVPAAFTAPGQTTISADKGTVSTDGAVITVSDLTLTAGASVKVTYDGSTAQKTAGEAGFVVKSKSGADGVLTELSTSPAKVTVGYAASGTGIISVSPTTVIQGATTEMAFTYTSIGEIQNGSLRISIPEDWGVSTNLKTKSLDQTAFDPNNPTQDRINSAVRSTDGRTVSVSIPQISADTSFTVTYELTAPAAKKDNEFKALFQGGPAAQFIELTDPSDLDKDGETSDNVLIVPTTPAASQIAFKSNPVSMLQGVSSTEIVIETRNDDGGPASPSNDLVVTFTSSSETGVFSLTKDGASQNAVTVAQGSTTGSVYYKDAAGSGTATLTATSSIGTATQAATITDVASKLVLTAKESNYVGDEVTLTVETQDSAGVVATTVSGVAISLALADGETGTITPATINLASGVTAGSAVLTGAAIGSVTVTASATGLTSGTGSLTFNNTVSTVSVSGSPVKAGNAITVTATGKPAAAATFSISGDVATGVTMTESTTEAGTYTGVTETDFSGIADGSYDVTVTIGAGSESKAGSVVVDNTAPSIASAVSDKTSLRNGESLTLTVEAEAGATVTADVSALDTTQAAAVAVAESATAGTYSADITISSDTTAESGDKKIVVTATDLAGNSSTTEVEIALTTYSAFDLVIPKGIGLIHVPLSVTEVNGEKKTIATIADLYDAIGDDKAFLITYDTEAGSWRSYLGANNKGSASDVAITDDLGIITVRTAATDAVTVNLKGNALGTAGASSMTLKKGKNLVGVPVKDSRIATVGELLSLEGVSATSAIVSQEGTFKVLTSLDKGQDSDVAITGGQSFIIVGKEDATVAVSGDAWDNVSAVATAAAMSAVGFEVYSQTPVMAIQGSLNSNGLPVETDQFKISLKNVNTGTIHTGSVIDNQFKLTLVDAVSAKVASVGDVLEISVETGNQQYGVETQRHTVSQTDVTSSLLSLPELVTYEIPAETALLANYPNPFNPETWVPFRLAVDSDVQLTIYNSSGNMVRQIDIGFKTAAVYETKDRAIYWDGRNASGEMVASGVYFYTLEAGDYVSTRKMLILK
ncbi:MAG: FlgD immunoglobulin-like domain containing protein [Candidatus Poribacteria bacterium]|nr:FlgD immunoglobulin-like domain containing protein [Candidatus Poribacteria bacterium]